MAHRAISHDEELLRERGERLTPQRRAVLKVMQDSHGHLSMEDVDSRLREQGDDIATASVYRILAWLTEQELVCITDVGARDVVYEYLGNRRHHHLICSQCGSEQEVPFGLISPVTNSVYKNYGFEARIDHLAIFGTCRECAADESETTEHAHG